MRIGHAPTRGLLATAVLGLAPGAWAQMGPAMNSFLTNVDPGLHNCGPFTFAQSLPPDRKLPLSAPSMVRSSKGSYTITAPGAAPFPGSSPRAGFFVQVTAIGSNVHCFETITYASRVDLVSAIRCVGPRGEAADTAFSWSYRADSLDFPQYAAFRANFGYARVRVDGAISTAFMPVRRASIVSKRLGPGRFLVRFGGLGTETAELDPARGLDVQVANVCGSGACGTRVCVPANWSVGPGATSVEVRCAERNGNPTDADFRVYVGQEAQNSQASGSRTPNQRFNEGINYGWVNSSDLASKPGPDPVRRPKLLYASVSKEHRGKRKISYFHTAPGKYAVTFQDHIIYGATCWALHVTARETDRGTYCNVDGLDHEKGHVGVACYDGDGNPRDARFVLGMRRQYNN